MRTASLRGLPSVTLVIVLVSGAVLATRLPTASAVVNSASLAGAVTGPSSVIGTFVRSVAASALH